MPAKRKRKAEDDEDVSVPKKRRSRKGTSLTNIKSDKKASPVLSQKVQSKNKSRETTPAATYTHWLMKSEPDSRFENGIDVKFGIEDLKKCPNQTDCWDGVRNYQARNFMRDQMKEGHDVFFYHSNCKEPGIAGVCKVVKESYVDHTQFDKKDPHYDRSAKEDNPRWYMVDVEYVRMLKRFISLSELKQYHIEHKTSGGPLKTISLFTRARLSVQPLTQEEWDFILTLEDTSKD